MPLYEYKCECGATIEKVRPIYRRYDVQCECGKVPQLRISASTFKFSSPNPFTIIGSEGDVLHHEANVDRVPYVKATKTGEAEYFNLKGV